MRISDWSSDVCSSDLRIVDRLVARDPDAAFAHIQSLMAQTQDLEARYELRDWLAHTRLRAGHPEAAVAGWVELHAEAASRSLPLPEPTAPALDLPPIVAIGRAHV